MISDENGTTTRKAGLPKMTQALGTKVRASRNVSDEVPINKPMPSPDTGITTAEPIASRRMSGNQTRDWPANKGSYMTYGKGSR